MIRQIGSRVLPAAPYIVLGLSAFAAGWFASGSEDIYVPTVNPVNDSLKMEIAFYKRQLVQANTEIQTRQTALDEALLDFGALVETQREKVDSECKKVLDEIVDSCYETIQQADSLSLALEKGLKLHGEKGNVQQELIRNINDQSLIKDKKIAQLEQQKGEAFWKGFSLGALLGGIAWMVYSALSGV